MKDIPLSAPTSASASVSLWQLSLRRFIKKPSVMISIVVLGLLVFIAFFGVTISAYHFDDVFWDAITIGPSFEKGHFFGTDNNGRDLFLRVLMGARISILIGIFASAVSVFIGVSYGAIAGYFGGRVDGIMMRIVDILYAMPFIFFVILLMVFMGKSIYLIFFALGAVEWLTIARIVRGQALTIKQKDYITAARSIGVPPFTIIRRHIIPNLLGPVIVYMTMTIPQTIILESFLSFLGLGVQEPMTSLGVLISDGSQQLTEAPWLLLFPAGTLCIIVICLNILGEGLRDALFDQHLK
ncbi:MAG: ABC transporter permease subunit [Alphaproteobacteria bacterium]|nr:ABC transporter permease subunit [Alphaproteobacteria bacterium]OJV45661.1 MAG: peptide ABC transporter permease [Alphaproteobacteria bacterium 43-37]